MVCTIIDHFRPSRGHGPWPRRRYFLLQKCNSKTRTGTTVTLTAKNWQWRPAEPLQPARTGRGPPNSWQHSAGATPATRSRKVQVVELQLISLKTNKHICASDLSLLIPNGCYASESPVPGRLRLSTSTSAIRYYAAQNAALHDYKASPREKLHL